MNVSRVSLISKERSVVSRWDHNTRGTKGVGMKAMDVWWKQFLVFDKKDKDSRMQEGNVRMSFWRKLIRRTAFNHMENDSKCPR